jgi:sugar/nucleoside kinase (ribokinase family)
MSLLVVGSVAIDSVETPFGKRQNILGGSATYFSVSASYFTDVNLVAVVGRDFPKRHIQQLKNKKVCTRGLEIKEGRTFEWKGRYDYDLNTAHTIYTRLNVFENFSPKIPETYKRTPYIFLANIDPDLQLDVLKNVYSPRLVACDSMNFWIANKLKSLKRLLRKVDILVINNSEARLLSGEGNILKATKYIFSLGPQRIIIKRGDSGAILLTKQGGCFSTPAYLMESVKDPTGAGDSFAGGFMGYLGKVNSLSENIMRRAVIYGTIMASFCVQDFGPNRLLRLTPFDIRERFNAYKRLTCF